ncbi:MAG TPA: hypothetical protein PK299_09185 [Anaerolineales bacterium]|nr:hypothetical protein [Anaerolineales bacterium]
MKKLSSTQIIFGLLPLVLSLVVVSLLIIVLGQNPMTVMGTLITGAIGTDVKIADSLVAWVSLAIVSMGLMVTFRAGQWNIGMEGQIMLGAIAAYAAGRVVWNSPGVIGIPVMILAGMAGGAFWAMLVALLRIYGGVHEIFAGLGLNFVTTSITIYLISKPWKPAGSSSVSTSELLPETLWLQTLPGLRISIVAVVLALLATLLIYFSLRGTFWGLRLKAVGLNPRGATLMGVPTAPTLLSSYIVCGMAAGLAGALLLTGVRHQIVNNISSGYGFTGILIVLLAGKFPILVPLAALIFAGLGVGGTAIRLSLKLDSSLAGIVTALLVLMFEIAQGLQSKYGKTIKDQ